MTYNFGTEYDLDLLAEWNHQLIRDEGHSNKMSILQLRERMSDWIKESYRAIIFKVHEKPVAYALYREDVSEIYLRQLFVIKKFRRQGVGKMAINILRTEVWPNNKRLTVEVLTKNEPAVLFWRSVGYVDYCLILEIMPE